MRKALGSDRSTGDPTMPWGDAELDEDREALGSLGSWSRGSNPPSGLKQQVAWHTDARTSGSPSVPPARRDLCFVLTSSQVNQNQTALGLAGSQAASPLGGRTTVEVSYSGAMETHRPTLVHRCCHLLEGMKPSARLAGSSEEIHPH